jgi:hypothetical protein
MRSPLFVFAARAGLARTTALGASARHDSLALDDLVEIALLSAGRGFLIHERKSLAVELLEEFLPRDRLECSLAAEPRKVDA